MKRISKRLISLLLVAVMCVSLLPVNLFAWSNMTHVNSADLLLLELQRTAKSRRDGRAGVTVYAPYDGPGYSYLIPEEFQDALFSYPDAFRAGSLGPDFYPDIIIGQMYIHPEDADVNSGDWITLLVDSVNRLPKDSSERKEALAFTLGYMLHYCGDLFGHDFINTFSGGPYPDLTKVEFLNSANRNLNNILSHMSAEAYMDRQVNRDFYSKNDYLDIAAPIQFVTDTMVLNGSTNGGAAMIFGEYGSMPPHFEYLVEWRSELYLKAEQWRDSMEPFTMMAVKYLDRWIEDQDRAIYALVECFDTIANRLVTEKDPSTVDIITEEVKAWGKEYGCYITGVPDIVIDGIPISLDIIDFILDAIGIGWLIDDLDEWLEDLIVELVLWATGLDQAVGAIKDYEERLKDPSVQLDHEDNPYMSGTKNFQEFKQYMDKYAAEQKLLNGKTANDLINGKDGGALDAALDSEMEAFYNTMAMFKLVLMGPDNFTTFVRDLTGRRQTTYKNKTAHLMATSLKLEITTADLYTAGTDDDIYAVVYKVVNGQKKEFMVKLLDKSGHDDFECGVTDVYEVELVEPVRVDQLEVSIMQVDTNTPEDEWICESINITPMHAGVALTETIGVGGNNRMDSGYFWDLEFQTAMQARMKKPQELPVTTLKLQIRTGKAGSAPGTDANIYLEVYGKAPSGGSTWGGSILLDKQKKSYNDFESGANDTYIVPISTYDRTTRKATGIPLNDLTIGLRHAGSDTWLMSDFWITPCYGNMELTQPIYIPDDVEFTLEQKNYKLAELMQGYTTQSYWLTDLSYETALDGSLLSYISSIDGGAQWENKNNILWSDVDLRSGVFFKIFKGFKPEMEYRNATAVQHKPMNLKVDLSGVWNGVREARREHVAGLNAMPNVDGTVTFTFLDSAGKAVCTTDEVKIVNNKAELKGYTNKALVPGTYDVKVNYTAHRDVPKYSDAEQTFTKGLRVVENGTVYDIVVDGGWAVRPGGEKVSSAKEGEKILLVRAEQPKELVFTGWSSVQDKPEYKIVPLTDKDPSVTAGTWSFELTGPVHIVANYKTVAKIEVTKKPTKNIYYAGEAFDPTGMVVKRVFTDGTSEVLKDTEYSHNASAYNPLVAGQTSVTISAHGKTVAVPVTVVASTTVSKVKFSVSGFEKGGNIANFKVNINTPGIEYTTMGNVTDFDLRDSGNNNLTSGTFKEGTEYGIFIAFRVSSKYTANFNVKEDVTLNGMKPVETRASNGSYIVRFNVSKFDLPKDDVTTETPKQDPTQQGSGKEESTATKVSDVKFAMTGFAKDANVADFKVSLATRGTQFTTTGNVTNYDLRDESNNVVNSGTFQAGKKYTVSIAFKLENDYVKDFELKDVTLNGAKPTTNRSANGSYIVAYEVICPDTVLETESSREVIEGEKDEETPGAGAPGGTSGEAVDLPFTDVAKDNPYAKAVKWAYENGIMSGYNATTFGANDTLSRAMVVQVLYNKEGQPAISGTHNFPDVNSSEWFNNAVTWGSQKGVVGGYGDGRFGPNDNVTVEQLVQILYNYAGQPEVTGDLSGVGNYSGWAAKALTWAANNGILDGVTFDNATGNAARAQTAQVLMNYLTK